MRTMILYNSSGGHTINPSRYIVQYGFILSYTITYNSETRNYRVDTNNHSYAYSGEQQNFGIYKVRNKILY
jgi:hypothetical protein